MGLDDGVITSKHKVTMMRRKRTDLPLKKRDTPTRTKSHELTPTTILPTWALAVIVSLILIIAYLQHQFVTSRAKEHTIPTVATVASQQQQQHAKQSLLTPEEDKDLILHQEIQYHVIFSTDCSAYQHWQSYLVYYTALQVRQPGTVTRIASGCNATEQIAMQDWFQNDIQYMSQRFRLHFTPPFSTVDTAQGKVDYKFFNKPFGLLHWLEHTEVADDDIVILIDPDMGLLKPITNDLTDAVISPRRQDHLITRTVQRGKPAAQVYGFGVQWARLDLEQIAGPDTPAAKVSSTDGSLYYPVGPPYLGTAYDMKKIAHKWTEFVPKVYDQYPHLLAEMFAFCIAAAHLELPFQLVDSFMISKTDAGGEGWPLIDAIPNVCPFAKNIDSTYNVPSVVHLCQRYLLGKDWFFAKRKIPADVYDCGTPLLMEPPDDVDTLEYVQGWNSHDRKIISKQEAHRQAFVLCYLTRIVNQAATFYKRNSCGASEINLKKERNLVKYLQEQQQNS